MAKKKDDDTNTLLWVLAGVGAAAGIWWWLRPREVAPGMTTTMPVPSTAPPAGFMTLGAVNTRFDDLRDIYHMGKLTPEEALSQVDGLRAAVIALRTRGIGDAAGAQLLMDALDDFQGKIQDFIDFKKSLEVDGAEPNAG